MCDLGNNIQCAVVHKAPVVEHLTATPEELDKLEIELADPLRVEMEANPDRYFCIESVKPFIIESCDTNGYARLIFSTDGKTMTAHRRRVGTLDWYRHIPEEEWNRLSWEPPF